MITVCHLVPMLMLDHGPSNVLFSIVERIDKKKVRVMVWSMRQPSPERSAAGRVSACGAEYRTFAMSSSFLDIGSLHSLWRALREDRPSILHCHLVRANLWGRLIAAVVGIHAVISTIHNVEAYMTGRRLVFRAVRWIEFVTRGLVTRYVCVSAGARLAAIKCLRLKEETTIAIVNGINVDEYEFDEGIRAEVRKEFGIREGEVVVGAVGNLTARKNHRLLVEAARALCTEDGRVRMIIVGEGEERRGLEAAIAKYDLGRHVVLAGARSDVSRVLCAMDLFVMPSLAEGFGLALAEAMAVGLPCIGSDVPGMSEVIVRDETGILVPPDDCKALTAAVRNLVTDEGLRRKMGCRGRTRAKEKFAAERMVREYFELYLAIGAERG